MLPSAPRPTCAIARGLVSRPPSDRLEAHGHCCCLPLAPDQAKPSCRQYRQGLVARVAVGRPGYHARHRTPSVCASH